MRMTRTTRGQTEAKETIGSEGPEKSASTHNWVWCGVISFQGVEVEARHFGFFHMWSHKSNCAALLPGLVCCFFPCVQTK